MKGLVGWPIVDGLPTYVFTRQLQVERETGKVCRPTFHCWTMQPTVGFPTNRNSPNGKFLGFWWKLGSQFGWNNGILADLDEVILVDCLTRLKCQHCTNFSSHVVNKKTSTQHTLIMNNTMFCCTASYIIWNASVESENLGWENNIPTSWR